MNLGDYEKANLDFDQAVKTANSSKAFYHKGLILMK